MGRAGGLLRIPGCPQHTPVGHIPMQMLTLQFFLIAEATETRAIVPLLQETFPRAILRGDHGQSLGDEWESGAATDSRPCPGAHHLQF